MTYNSELWSTLMTGCHLFHQRLMRQLSVLLKSILLCFIGRAVANMDERMFLDLRGIPQNLSNFPFFLILMGGY